MNPPKIYAIRDEILGDESEMKYLRWIHIEDYASKYEAYIEDESADIIEDESIDPKKINPVIIIDDKSTDPEMRRVVLY
jgi:hypothetical protein